MAVVTSGQRPRASQWPSPWEDGPVPVVSADDAVLVRGDLRPTWRAVVPSLVAAVCFAALAGTAGDDFADVDAFAWVVAGLFVASGALRVLIWFHGMAARVLISTDTHLVLMRRGKAERWIPWAAVTGIRVYQGDLLPEWHRGGGTWFTVWAEPSEAMRPLSPFAQDLGEFLVRRRDRADAVGTIEAAAHAHGVRVLESH